MIDQLVKIASGEVGVRESGGNNRGSRIREYQAATNLAPAAWPWCAAFVCWCIREWLKDPEARAWLGLKTTTPAKWRPTTAAAFGFIEWAQKRPNTIAVLDEAEPAHPGDIIVFDFSHIGIVAAATATRIYTIEGNTNGRGDRDSETGDGVWTKTRARSLARCFLRIHPSAA